MEMGAATELWVTRRAPHRSLSDQRDEEHRCVTRGMLQGTASGFLGAFAAPHWQPRTVALLPVANGATSLRPTHSLSPLFLTYGSSSKA